MKINKENYEIFFLDYSEGTLSNQERLEVEKFMSENPELAAELNAPLPSLTDGASSGFSLDSMKKELIWDEAEVSDLLISELEGTIDAISQTSEEKARLAQFVATFPDEVSKLKKIIALTRLNMGETVPYADSQKHDLFHLPEDHKSYAAIASVEGDLTRKEQTEFLLLAMQDKSVAEDLKLIKKTVLVPNEISLPASFKENLKKKGALIIPLWAKRAAAVAAIFIAVFFVTNQSHDSGSITAEFTPREGEVEMNFTDDLIEQSPDYLAEEKDETIIKEDVMSTDEQKENAKDSSPGLIMNQELNPSNNHIAEQPENKLQEIDYLSSEAVAFLPASELLLDTEVRGGSAELLSVENLAIYQPDEELLAEAHSESDVLSPLDLVTREFKKSVSEDADERLAVTLVNKTAEKLSGDDDFMAYSDSDSKSGFRLKIGKLSIESTR